MLCTFVIPTIGRESIGDTLRSLIQQTDGDWRALIVCDGDEPFMDLAGRSHLPHDDRFKYVSAPKTGSAGLTRNFVLPWIKSRWTGFVDDDDTLAKQYVEWLREEGGEQDVVVFRMYHQELGILPPYENAELRWGQVGLSFAVRSAWWDEDGVEFIREENPDDLEKAVNEDIALLTNLKKREARIHISKRIGYFVGPEQDA